MVEVEISLPTYPGIRQAIVVARQNDLGESYLSVTMLPIYSRRRKMSDLRMF